MVWKNELKRELSAVVRCVKKRDIKSESLGIKIERFYFLSAFIIRKLMEADKLSNEVSFQKIQLNFHKYINTKGFVDKFNNHHIDKFYDLENKTQVSKDLRWLCGKLIHSFCFSQVFNEANQFAGVFFNSDENKKEGLWYLGFGEYKRIVDSCINDQIIFASYNRETSQRVLFSSKSRIEKWMVREVARRTSKGKC